MTGAPVKILVAVDGSDQSFEAVRYTAQICHPERTNLALFNVISEASESFWDHHDPAVPLKPGKRPQWEAHQAENRQAFIYNVKEMLLEHGFAEDHIKVNIQHRREGIARDIINEAAAGYDAVVAGRVGTNPIARLVMGSVAAKLTVSLTGCPLWLVDGHPSAERVLIAIDASTAALDVVAHVGKILADSETAMTLFHVIRDPDGGPQTDSEENLNAQQSAKTAMAPVFERAFDVLENAGISKDRVSAKLITGVATRAGTIFAQALHGRYGTVAVGRRGLSRVDKFPLGRVTNKMIQLANDMAVWIVS